MNPVAFHSRLAAADASAARRLIASFAALGRLLLIAAAIGLAPAAYARTGDDDAQSLRPADVGTGRLLFRGERGESFVAAPLVKTAVDIQVSGIVARARVIQNFRNDGANWVEGIYVFPLPEGAAVDRLKLRVSERVIEGEIQERQQAQRTYQQAKSQGQRAGLIEQERPNIFTTSLANIGPGETIAVEIEYQETLRYDRGAFALRFPLVVAPRYIPGDALVAAARGWAPPTNDVPDAHRITPPVRTPLEGKGNPVTLTVDLDAGMALAAVESVSHAITVTPGERGRVRVALSDAEVPAERDFVLSWKPASGAAPAAGLFIEQRDRARHLLVLLVPPEPGAVETTAIPREAIFIIDTSGSMAGTSIEQAKAALKLALDRLTARDRFNIIEFNSRASVLFGSPQPATGEALRAARSWVEALRAQGGTEMLPALDLALDGASDPARLRQVVFLTDGAVGNENALFRRIDAKRGDSRLFTIGIGSAPNGWFMREAARVGRGTFTNISRIDDVQARMSALFAKLERPILTDLEVTWPAGVTPESFPDPLPDLYAGEPVVVTARVADGALLAGQVVTIAGRRDGTSQRTTTWSGTMALDGGAERPGVAALWARRKIDGLLERAQRGESPAEARQSVIELALGYRLVSKYTSLVAVDKTPARPADTTLHSTQVPTNLPDGWQYDKVFGAASSGSAPSQQYGGDAGTLDALHSVAANIPAAPSPIRLATQATAEVRERSDPAAKVGLPQTATDAWVYLLIGLALLLLALILLTPAMWRRSIGAS